MNIMSVVYLEVTKDGRAKRVGADAVFDVGM